ncbi:YdbL family protein [Candidatus Nitronereus thalassa]|uniref:YdbL family protein n=1 Tax=Candidatus Nitronereus thalassa TaxID=3020898 RepID=A0ABU3K7W9_9BACT|nr:YdbL family protein [Candidatus Nitronereus thalassa]MDT7042496.1 YdbL family protein [Candidatus Nitronereus thalassa]
MYRNTQQWTIQCLLIVFMVIGAGTNTWALSLDEAKDQGLVGERANGYLGAVKSSPSSDVQALIRSINSQRKQRYQEIAASNNTDLEAVEILAGKTAINKTKPGHYIQLPSDGWTKK